VVKTRLQRALRQVEDAAEHVPGRDYPRTVLAVYASAPASIDRAAADVIGERFFGEKAKRAAGTKSSRHFRANPSEGSGAPES